MGGSLPAGAKNPPAGACPAVGGRRGWREARDDAPPLLVLPGFSRVWGTRRHTLDRESWQVAATLDRIDDRGVTNSRLVGRLWNAHAARHDARVRRVPSSAVGQLLTIGTARTHPPVPDPSPPPRSSTHSKGILCAAEPMTEHQHGELVGGFHNGSQDGLIHDR